MESKISIYISTLKDYQIKGMKYEGIDDKDGTIYQKSEAGIEFNIIRWINHKYTLSLQYLTFQECENIIRERIKIKQERKLLNIPKELIVKKGYIDFKAMPNDKDYNALSVIVQYLYDVEYLMKVSKNVFNPKPNVDSAVISFIKKERLEVKDEKRFFKLVKDAFKWRRKTLYNNLKDDYDDDKILKAFKELKLKDAIRAQELDLRTFIRLDEVINDV